jgi:hypothetical protein
MVARFENFSVETYKEAIKWGSIPGRELNKKMARADVLSELRSPEARQKDFDNFYDMITDRRRQAILHAYMEHMKEPLPPKVETPPKERWEGQGGGNKEKYSRDSSKDSGNRNNNADRDRSRDRSSDRSRSSGRPGAERERHGPGVNPRPHGGSGTNRRGGGGD